jgi:cardiolipin synthase
MKKYAKYIPNILTFIRFLLIPIIIVAIFSKEFLVAFIIFTISAITDILDGYIARKFNFVTNIGKLLDPLADKLTQMGILLSLSLMKIIPYLILIIVVIKETVMIGGASFLYGKNVVVYSRWYGKLATVLFYLAIITSLLTAQFSAKVPNHLDLYLYALALFSTVFSLLMYFKALHKNGYINKDDLHKDVTVYANKKK